ncbi:MAG TPA: hypothetical protein VEL07_04780 [Planctomycetota bacterium]|nr:hypothetical protein [Planctomycetota bacterium]
MRVLPTLIADGATQMAWDEALLDSAAVATLRTYRWVPPTVSLGYFQDHADVRARLPPGMAVVRRITGGGAIWHEHEVTYAVIGTLGTDGWPATPRRLYQVLHAAILARLDGGRFALQAETTGDRRYRDEPRCFASPAVDDVVVAGGGKVLGSAARTRGRRVLVHGSLKLASNPWDAATVAGCGLAFDAARDALVAGVASAFATTAEPGATTSDEIATMERIRNERYGSAGWVERREGRRP